MNVRIGVTIVLSLLALTGSAKGEGAAGEWDRIELVDGRVLTGSVTREGPNYRVRRGLGSIMVPALDVLRLDQHQDPLDEIERQRETLVGVPARLRFAKLVEAQGLRREAKAVYRRILLIDANQRDARKALGFVRHKGEWLTRDQRERALGHVKHKGAWVTVAVRDAALRKAAALREAARQRAAARVAKLRPKRAEHAVGHAKVQAARQAAAPATPRVKQRATFSFGAIPQANRRRSSSWGSRYGNYGSGQFGYGNYGSGQFGHGNYGSGQFGYGNRYGHGSSRRGYSRGSDRRSYSNRGYSRGSDRRSYSNRGNGHRSSRGNGHRSSRGNGHRSSSPRPRSRPPTQTQPFGPQPGQPFNQPVIAAPRQVLPLGAR